MGIFMLTNEQKELKDIRNDLQDIDDCYYEVFRLLQKELEDAVDEHPEAVPTGRVRGILTATDIFYRNNYGTKESTDRTGEGEL